MSLTEKSDEEISQLLAEYGIKHGPIVDSTRHLYEKKLEKVMKSAPVKTSSDKTYYREEKEEITYITYSPVRHEAYGEMLKRRGHVEPDEDEEEEDEDEDEESDHDTEPPIQMTNRAANHSTAAVRSKEPVRKSGGSVWKVIRLLLLLAVLAAVLYYAYCRVMNNEEDPVGIQ